MKITHDKKVDAVYIKLNEDEPYEKTKKITDNVMIDYSANGKVVGIEVLDASNNIIFSPEETSIPIEVR